MVAVVAAGSRNACDGSSNGSGSCRGSGRRGNTVEEEEVVVVVAAAAGVPA